MSPLQEESGCDEDEDEEESREEEEEDGFDSDESLVDSDSDSDDKGEQLSIFNSNNRRVPGEMRFRLLRSASKQTTSRPTWLT